MAVGTAELVDALGASRNHSLASLKISHGCVSFWISAPRLRTYGLYVRRGGWGTKLLLLFIFSQNHLSHTRARARAPTPTHSLTD